MNGTVPSTENAGSIKVFKARGQAIADNVTCYEVEKGVYTEVADPEFLD